MNKLKKIVWAARFENYLNCFKWFWNQVVPKRLVWHTSISAHLRMASEIKRILEPEKVKI